MALLPARSVTWAVSELLPLRQRDRDAPAAVGCTTALPSAVGAVEQGDGRAGIGDVDRAGDGLRRLVGRTTRARDRHQRCGGIEREAERGGAGIAEAVGLARHDGVGAVGKPGRGERPGALRIGGHGGGDGLPSMVKCTTVLASPLPLSASFEVMWSLAEEPVSMVSASVSVGAVVLSV